MRTTPPPNNKKVRKEKTAELNGKKSNIEWGNRREREEQKGEGRYPHVSEMNG